MVRPWTSYISEATLRVRLTRFRLFLWLSSPSWKSFWFRKWDYLLTVSLFQPRVIQEANLYYLLILVRKMKLLLPATSLSITQNSHPKRIHDFHEKLVISAQALDTMNKLKKLNGYVRSALNKLLGIRADLVRIDDDWQEWTLISLLMH